MPCILNSGSFGSQGSQYFGFSSSHEIARFGARQDLCVLMVETLHFSIKSHAVGILFYMDLLVLMWKCRFQNYTPVPLPAFSKLSKASMVPRNALRGGCVSGARPAALPRGAVMQVTWRGGRPW